MSLTNPQILVRAAAGAANPFTGGSVSLVDRGGGVYAFRVNGGLASVAATTTNPVSGTGDWNSASSNPWCFAVQYAIQTEPSTNYQTLFGVDVQASAATQGVFIAKNGSSSSHRVTNPTQTIEVAIGNAGGSTLRTVAVRVRPAASGTLDSIDVWVNTTGRIGTAANYTASLSNFPEVLMAVRYFMVNATNGGVLDVATAAAWWENRTDAEMSQIADNIGSLFSPVGPTRSVTVRMFTTSGGTTTAANLSGLRWAFFDQSTNDTLLAPTDKGASGTTNSSGDFTVNLSGTTLAAGATGWLTVSNSTGDPAASFSSFSGPVVIS